MNAFRPAHTPPSHGSINQAPKIALSLEVSSRRERSIEAIRGHCIAFALVALLGVASQGCARNLMIPQKEVASFEPAATTQSARTNALTIFVTEAPPSFEEVVFASPFRQDYERHVKRVRGLSGVWNYWVTPRAESALALRACNLMLLRTDLQRYLESRFPQAKIVQDFTSMPEFVDRYRHVTSVKRIGTSSRTIPTPYPGKTLRSGLEPRAFPQADIMISIDLRQGISGEEAAMQGLSFGRYYSVTYEAWTPGSPSSFYHTLYGRNESQPVLDALFSNANQPPTDSELRAFRKTVASSSDYKDPEWVRTWYVGASAEEISEAATLAAFRASKLKNAKTVLGQIVVKPDAMKSYTDDINTSPLLPVMKDLAEGIGKYVQSGSISHEARTRALREWASHYYSSDSVLNRIDSRSFPVEVTTPTTEVEVLSALFQVEQRFATRLGQVYLSLVDGSFGDLARNSLREQTKILSDYQTVAVVGGLIGVAGAGAGAAIGGAAGNAFSQSMAHTGQMMLIAGSSADRASSERLGNLIAERIGDVDVAIGQTAAKIQARTFEEFRVALKERFIK